MRHHLENSADVSFDQRLRVIRYQGWGFSLNDLAEFLLKVSDAKTSTEVQSQGLVENEVQRRLTDV